LQGIPASIDSITQMPKGGVMERIIDALDATPVAATKPDDEYV